MKSPCYFNRSRPILNASTCCDSAIMPRGEWKSAQNALEKFYIQFSTTRKAYDCKQASKNQDGTTETPQPMLRIEGNAHRKRNIVSLESDEESSVSSDDAAEPIQIKEKILRKNDQNTIKLELKEMMRKWNKWELNWKQLYPNNVFLTFDPFDELMNLDEP